MTDQELISQLKQLKEIKPSQPWAALVKMNILQAGSLAPKSQVATLASRWSFSALWYQRKLVYGLAVMLVALIGVGGIFTFGLLKNPQVAQSPEAVLVASNNLKNNVELFKLKSQNYAQAAKTKPEQAALALKEVQDAAKQLTDSIEKNPQLAGSIALDVNNNKTVLDILGGNELDEVSDVYKVIVVQELKALEKVTLTQDQQEEVARIKASLKQGNDYTTALRDILLINASRDAKPGEAH